MENKIGKSIFAATLAVFARHLVKVVMPYVLGSMALAALGIVCVYKFAFSETAQHGALQIIMTAVLCLIYFPLAFFYGMFLAGLSTLRTIAGAVEDAVSDFISRLKKHVERKVDSMRDGVPKRQAQMLLNSGIKEVAAEYKNNKSSGVGRAAALFLLSFITWASRGVLFQKLKKAGGAKISFALLFAGPEELALAAAFNLEFTATALLVLGYIFGLIILGSLLVFIIL